MKHSGVSSVDSADHRKASKRHQPAGKSDSCPLPRAACTCWLPEELSARSMQISLALSCTPLLQALPCCEMVQNSWFLDCRTAQQGVQIMCR